MFPNEMGPFGGIRYFAVLRQTARLVINLKIISGNLSQKYLQKMFRW